MDTSVQVPKPKACTPTGGGGETASTGPPKKPDELHAHVAQKCTRTKPSASVLRPVSPNITQRVRNGAVYGRRRRLHSEAKASVLFDDATALARDRKRTRSQRRVTFADPLVSQISNRNDVTTATPLGSCDGKSRGTRYALSKLLRARHAELQISPTLCLTACISTASNTRP